MSSINLQRATKYAANYLRTAAFQLICGNVGYCAPILPPPTRAGGLPPVAVAPRGGVKLGVPMKENDLFKTGAAAEDDDNETINFQSAAILLPVCDYLRSPKIQAAIEGENPHKTRYNKNNDWFCIIKMGDVVGLSFYDGILDNARAAGGMGRVFIASDNIEHKSCVKLIEKFNAVIIDKDEIEVAQFASTCRNIILCGGIYSLLIGYISFYSTQIYYPRVGDAIPAGWKTPATMAAEAAAAAEAARRRRLMGGAGVGGSLGRFSMLY
jgi:hypothetical protein